MSIINFGLCCIALSSLTIKQPNKEIYSKFWIWAFLILTPAIIFLNKITGIIHYDRYRLNLFGTIVLLIPLALGLLLANQVHKYSKENPLNQKKDSALFIIASSLSFILLYLEKIVLDNKLNPFNIIIISLLAIITLLGGIAYKHTDKLKLTIIISSILCVIISLLTF